MMDDGACLYYKLTNKPKGSGELKTEKLDNNLHMDKNSNYM